MVKYYTRACNFYYGPQAKKLIKDYVDDELGMGWQTLNICL